MFTFFALYNKGQMTEHKEMPPIDLNVKFRLHQEHNDDNFNRLTDFIKTLLSSIS